MNVHADILIIGGGIIGTSIAHYLTDYGQKNVILCEQDRPPGIGATKMSGGLLRLSHTNEIQMELAWKSYPVFANWQELIGGSCGFSQTGFALLVSEEYKENLLHNTLKMQNMNMPIVLMLPNEFKKIQPFVSMKDVSLVAYEPESGYADPYLSTMGFIEKAKQKGLKLMQGTKIINFLIKGSKIEGVKTNIGNIYSERVIVCGGAWTPSLLQTIGVEIPLKKRQIGIRFFDWQLNETRNTFNLMTYIDDSYGCYFRSLAKNEILVGINSKNKEESVDNKLLCANDIRSAHETIMKRIPHATFKSIGGRYSFDAYTPDSHPIIGPIENIEGIYLATGFSGGGFKIAPAVGEKVAREILEGKADKLLSKLRLERFENKKLIDSQKPYAYM